MISGVDGSYFLPQLCVETEEPIDNAKEFYSYLRDECIPAAEEGLGLEMTKDLFSGLFDFMCVDFQNEAFQYVPMLKEWQAEQLNHEN